MDKLSTDQFDQLSAFEQLKIVKEKLASFPANNPFAAKARAQLELQQLAYEWNEVNILKIVEAALDPMEVNIAKAIQGGKIAWILYDASKSIRSSTIRP